MSKKLFVTSTLIVLCVLLFSLTAGAQQSTVWHKDPDSVDPVKVVTSTLLPAPDVTLGDTDMTVVGIGDSIAGPDATTADPPDPPSSGNTFWVDNTPLDGDCPQATFTSIQAAVDASGPNDTVKVCPGTYPEQVRIAGHNHDGLRLESLTPLAATIQWPVVESAPLALVDFNTADHVTVRGFTISGPFTFPACSPERHEGLLIENAFDERIMHNHITMIENSDPALRGCQEGDAVAVGHRVDTCGGTLPGSAQVWQNVIDEYQKNGVQVFNNGTSANVSHNQITGPIVADQPHAASNGVVVFCSASATVEQNAISKNHFTGPFALATSGGVIFAGAPPGSSELDHNRIFDNDYGIETDSQNGLDISHNTVQQHITDGIVLCGDPLQGCSPATQIVARANDVTQNRGSGLLLLGADSNLLKSNHVADNGTSNGDTTDGIRIDTKSMQNQILTNQMENNVTHDCHDDSSGTGSGGTANTWMNDFGATQNRDGLCKGATTTP